MSMPVRGWRRYDPVLVLTALLLFGYGLLLIYSGSLGQYETPGDVLRGPIVRQFIYLAAAVALMIVVARLDYRTWSGYAPVLFAIACVGLIIVFFIGTSEYGSRRWISLPGFQIQPSEPAKLATIVLLARMFAASSGGALPGRVFLTSLGITAIPALLVFKEPDLGTAIVFLAVWLGMSFVAGARIKHIALLSAAFAVALPFIMLVAIHGYQKERLAIFFNPDHDPLGTGFNVNQAAISIGSGGLWGKGLTDGTQTQLEFLRTQTTDYIFSVLGEELGFVGAMILFALFLLLLYRALRVAATASDDAGRLIAAGIVVMILTQVFVNIGVNIRLFPVTGIPLPFISQGGSSLLSMFMALGVLQSIHSRRRQPGMARPLSRLEWA